MNELTQRLEGLSAEKRRLIEMLLRVEHDPGDNSGSYAVPSTEVERQMVEIWEEILGRRPIGIHDNFFQLGGDSIQAIRITARAREAGIEINTNHIFNRPTIADLVAELPAGTILPKPEEGLLEGPLPMGPVQHWFFEQNFPHPDHWNESILLECVAQLTQDVLEAAIRALLEQHDSLRLRFVKTPQGMRAEYAPMPHHLPLEQVTVDPEDLPGAIRKEADRIQASLSPANGSVIRFCWIKIPNGHNDRLLIVAHHLTIDGISGRILVEDLAKACSHLFAGKPVELGRKSAAFRQWTQFLETWSKTDDCSGQMEWWTAEQTPLPTAIPFDQAHGENTEAAASEVQIGLDAGDTQRLLRSAGRDINAVFLTGLAIVLREWTGSSRIQLDMEGHGREALDGAPDVSRTIGWFTSIFPLHFDIGTAPGITQIFESARRKLQAVPSNGIGYGVLRYVTRQLRKTAAASQIIFNYLGQFDDVLVPGGPFRATTEEAGKPAAAGNTRPHLLQVVGAVSNGCLRFRFIYSSAFHREETISRQANSFRTALLQIVELLETQGSDAASLELDPAELKEISRRYAE